MQGNSTKINYWRCCAGKKEAKRRWREGGWFPLSKSHLIWKQETSTKIVIERLIIMLCWQKRGVKKIERGWFAPFEQVPLILNTGKIHRNQRSMILFESNDWKSCCEMAKKRWKEDGERLVGSLQVPLSQREQVPTAEQSILLFHQSSHCNMAKAGGNNNNNNNYKNSNKNKN